jgi:poly-gamma-glutamate synthesis protein (capsule biosynthesis protein)
MFPTTPSKSPEPTAKAPDRTRAATLLVTLFLCGDVMTGRGIDQVLPHPSDPVLYESYITDARAYVRLAEQAHGPIEKPVSHSHIWGDALAELERVSPDLRIINLETSVTASDDYWKGKGINYRMHPKNMPAITAAKIDLCVLANNHVLDWGYGGLIETLDTLEKAKVKSVGAGRNLAEAEAPAVLETKEKGRVVVFSFGSPTSGVPLLWAATVNKAGLNVLRDLSKEAVRSIQEKVGQVKRPGDICVVSIHWGGNWGFTIPRRHREFAHSLIDHAGVDIIYGHSSHHIKGIEVYNGKPILYGCGDFLNDYEGIGGYERFRGDLGLMYFVSMDPQTVQLARLQMTPTQMRNFRVNRASRTDALWLRDTLNREGAALGTQVDLDQDNTLTLRWK